MLSAGLRVYREWEFELDGSPAFDDDVEELITELFFQVALASHDDQEKT
jgi:hypothetical protein